jgi:hypothetical protein
VNSLVLRFMPTGLNSNIQSHPRIKSYPYSSSIMKSDVNL